MAGIKEVSVEEKLKSLFNLQTIDSNIDEIQILKGELPMEVSDLEDEMAGLETRTNKLEEELDKIEEETKANKQSKKEATAIIKKYEKQQGNVKNNREFEALSKEIELQNLQIQLIEKHMGDSVEKVDAKKELMEESQAQIKEKKKDLTLKKKDLEKIITETEKEEKGLEKKSDKASKIIEERIITAYHKIRKTYQNGLAVVKFDRDSCGGCFNKIPPQRQLEIRQRKKLIVCEHCGRILVDPEIDN